jgi:hypothetical protein
VARRRRLFIGCVLVPLLLLGGCGVGFLALMPGEGPPILACLPPDADVVACAWNADELWEMLASTAELERLREGEAFRLLRGTEAGEAFARALGSLHRAGVTRSRASHLVGREAGAAVWLDPEGRAARDWLAAFRIDTLARIAELAAGRLFLRGMIERGEESGAAFASYGAGQGSVHWTRLGDLLVAASSRETLARAARSGRAASGEEAASREDAWDVDPARRFGLICLEGEGAGPGGFRAAAKVSRLRSMIGKPGARGGGPVAAVLDALGVPERAEAASLYVGVRGREVLEESFFRGEMPPTETGGEPAAPARPEATFFWWRSSPGIEGVSGHLWRPFRLLSPPGPRLTAADRRVVALAGAHAYRDLLLPLAGPEVVVCLAEQELPEGGREFPAFFSFFTFAGRRGPVEALERLLAERSLGVFEEGGPEPTSFPYAVRRPRPQATVFEMVVRDTRRHEGFRPAIALVEARAGEASSRLVFASSLDALDAFLKADGRGAGPTPSDRPRASGDAGDGWLDLEGQEVLRLEWRTPSDLRPLRNAYDFLAETARARASRAYGLAEEEPDHEALGDALEEALGLVAGHVRVGVWEADGLRMRARWTLGR